MRSCEGQIISGRLPAGRRLLADELADSLAISQTPVKEALARLTLDGLVEGSSRRASTVRRFTLADIEEIYDARMLLELHAVSIGVAAGRATPEFADDLEALFRQHLAHVEKQTREELAEAIRLDRAFHELLVSLGGNRLTAGWHRMVLRQTQTIRNYSLRYYDMGRTRSEHQAIVDAVRAGDRDKVVEALRIHLIASRDEFLSRPAEDLPIRP